MLNAFQINQKNYTLLTFPSSNRPNFEDSGKVLAVSVFDFFTRRRFLLSFNGMYAATTPKGNLIFLSGLKQVT